MSPAIVLILIGFVVLMTGAEFTVRGAVGLANKLGVPPMVIGLTVVAFGTALPEFVLSMQAVARGAGGFSLGNVVGANIANVMLILGMTAMIAPFRCNVAAISRDYKFLMFVTVLFMIFVWGGEINAIEGVLLLSMLLVYLGYNYRSSKYDDAEMFNTSDGVERGWLRVLFMLIAGGYAIRYGSDWLLEGAVDIAENHGVSKETIGLTLIAFGTSLPELATTVTASIHKHADVAIGNIIGSNIINILLVVGFVGVAAGIQVPDQFLNFDIWVMFLASGSILPVVYRTQRVSRLDGLTYFFSYLVYMGTQWLIVHGDVDF